MSHRKDRQERFCHEYLIDLNATQAAIRAGYSEKTAQAQSSRLLSSEVISTRIKTLMKKRENRTQITQDRVLQEYSKLAFVDIRKLYDQHGNLLKITDIDDDTAAAILSIDVCVGGEEEKVYKYKLTDKRAALDSVARHLGMFEKDNNQRKAEFNFVEILEEIDGSSTGLPDAEE